MPPALQSWRRRWLVEQTEAKHQMGTHLLTSTAVRIQSCEAICCCVRMSAAARLLPAYVIALLRVSAFAAMDNCQQMPALIVPYFYWEQRTCQLNTTCYSWRRLVLGRLAGAF
jgi:hypothetical protein